MKARAKKSTPTRKRKSNALAPVPVEPMSPPHPFAGADAASIYVDIRTTYQRGNVVLALLGDIGWSLTHKRTWAVSHEVMSAAGEVRRMQVELDAIYQALRLRAVFGPHGLLQGDIANELDAEARDWRPRRQGPTDEKVAT